MRNKFRNLPNVNCAILYYMEKLSLERKYTNKVSVFTLQLNMNSYGI